MKKLLGSVLMCTLCLMATELDFEKESQLQNACDKGEFESCVVLGSMYHRGDGVRQSYANAIKLYTHACSQNYGKGCTHLGFVYENGHGFNVDAQKARDLLQRRV
jgi:TPR repeat protein